MRDTVTLPGARTRVERAAGWTALRLAALLALTALPVLLTTLIAILSGGALARTGPLAGFAPNVVSHATYAFCNWVAFALVWAIAGSDALRAHGMRWRLTWGRLGAALLGFAAGVAIYLVVTWLQRRTGLPTTEGMAFRRLTAAEIAVLSFSVALTAPLCEEVFFRVLWVGGLARRVPVPAAVTCAILAFAVIHYPYFGAGGVIFISLWTLVPVVLFLRTGDFTASLVMHVLNNVWAYLIVPILF